MNANNTLTIIQYTDPMCIWCYGLDVALRKIEFSNDNVELHNVLGLLVRDSKEIIDDDEFAPLRFTQLKEQMRAHFLDAGERAGLPLDISHLDSKKASDITSLPASLCVMAMKLVHSESQSAYLRRVREAFHSDGLNTSDEGVLLDLAGEFLRDFDEQNAFKSVLKNGEAQKALQSDLQRVRAKSIRAFPTLELVYGEKSQILQGFIEYEDLKRIITRLSDGECVLREMEFSDEGLVAFVTRFKRVSEREASIALHIDTARLRERVNVLENAGVLETQQCGNSYFISLPHSVSRGVASGFVCKNGVCQNVSLA